MKLLLTSAGIESNGKTNAAIATSLRSLLSKATKHCRALMITHDTSVASIPYVNEAKLELQELGILDIDVFDLSHDDPSTIQGKFDLLYMNGGNTFHILEKLRAQNLVEPIKQMVENGTVYFGVSAGSILAGPDISIAGMGSQGDKNDIALENLTAFHFTDLIIFPHYRPEFYQEAGDMRTRFGNKLRVLSDEQAIQIKDGEERKIG